MLLSVSHHNFRREVLDSPEPVIVNFWIGDNDDCTKMRLQMRKLSEDWFNNMKVAGINLEQEQELSRRYDVFGVPTVLVFHNGRVIARYSGTFDAGYVLKKFDNMTTDNTKTYA